MGKVVGVVLVDEALAVELAEPVMEVLFLEPVPDATLEPDADGAEVAVEGSREKTSHART